MNKDSDTYFVLPITKDGNSPSAFIWAKQPDYLSESLSQFLAFPKFLDLLTELG